MSSLFKVHLKNLNQRFLAYISIVLISICTCLSVSANNIDIADIDDVTVGKYIEYFQEEDQVLSIKQAQKMFDSNRVKQGSSNSISSGIGVNPVWMKFSIHNSQFTALKYRLAIETPWLDHIDTWLVRNGDVIRYVRGGDAVPFEKRPMPYRFYAFENDYLMGTTDVYIRVESVGPMAIPIRLSSVDKAIARDISAGYQYGVLYGVMSALALYNLVLFVFIRQREYGLYSLYLIGFVLNSLSYTGQIHAIFTPDFGPYFQDWTDIFLMITYSVFGLHFARLLLDTKSYAPRLDRLVTNITLFIPLGMLIGFIFNQLVFSTTLAFILNCGFVILFIAIGIYAYKENKPYSVIFLISSVTAAICITVSTLAVAGLLIPYNDYTFKAIEVGMALEAILLAVILARQFQTAKLDKILAERYARTDPLTQLYNRRGFKQNSAVIWQEIVRTNQDVAIILVDIDGFKAINDELGHHGGDEALKQVARCLKIAARKGDITARWGGEEFIIFLPETPQQFAQLQAERLRTAVEKLNVMVDNNQLKLTASFGVAGTEESMFAGNPINQYQLEQMINFADKALYSAKGSGKNQVCTLEVK